MTVPPDATESHGHRVFVLGAIILLALNLRSVVTSLGVSLDAVTDELAMGPTTAGLLTSLPVLSFAVFGSTANKISRAVGLHRTAALSLAAVVVGMAVRATADSATVFTLATTLSLAGAATGNVILPPLVKRHFPHRIGGVTALYTAGILLSGAAPAALTGPILEATGGWRTGLAVWAGVAAVALLPWLALLRHDVHVAATPVSSIPMTRLMRSPLAWAMVLFFGVQASGAYIQMGWITKMYVDEGLGPSTAGLMLGILAAVGIPIALLLPYAARRLPSQHLLPVIFGLSTSGGWLGIYLLPTTTPWIWAVLLGIGGGAFPWNLSMIGLRTRTPDGTAALSGFVQSGGYLIAAIGPLGVAMLHDLTGSWDVPLLVLVATGVPLVLLGWVVASPRLLEDTLPD